MYQFLEPFSRDTIVTDRWTDRLTMANAMLHYIARPMKLVFFGEILAKYGYSSLKGDEAITPSALTALNDCHSCSSCLSHF